MKPQRQYEDSWWIIKMTFIGTFILLVAYHLTLLF